MKNFLIACGTVGLMAVASALLLTRTDLASAMSSQPASEASQVQSSTINMAPVPASANGIANKLSLANAALAEEMAQHMVTVVVDRARTRPSAGGTLFQLPGMGPQNDDPTFKDLSIGPYTGVMVSNDGEILVSDAILGLFDPRRDDADARVRDIYVSLADGRTFEAEVVGRDGESQLALLKIEAEGLNAFDFDSGASALLNENLRGRSITVVTRSYNPFRYGASDGIVSAELRENGRAFQVDTRIGGSDLGGLVVDKASRKVVGVLTMLDVERVGQASGIAYAAHVAGIRKSLALLREGIFQPAPPKPFLGIQMEERESGVGLLISDVTPGAAAAKAGVEVGDILLRANGIDTNTRNDLLRALAPLNAGDKMTLLIERDGNQKELVATLVSRDQFSGARRRIPLPERREPQPERKPQSMGVRGGVVDGEFVVSEVTENSNAERAGVQVGDRIQAIDGEGFSSIDDLLEILKNYDQGDTVTLDITRDGQAMEVKLTFK